MRHGAMLGYILGAFLALAAFAPLARASHYAIVDVPSLISAADAARLGKAGISTTEELFHRGAKLPDRKGLARATGLPGAVLWTLVKRCDLLRIRGVGPEMVLLLEAAGVDSSAELAKREPAALTRAANAANKVKKISEKPPTEPQFDDWIAQAKHLPQMIEAK